MNDFEKQIISVSQLNRYANVLLEGNELLGDVYVKGEISNFKKYSSGHLYFSLKDENAAIAGVMWRSYASNLEFMPSDGLKVIAHGRVSLYEASGRYQIVVDSLIPEGIGSLYYAYEQLKNKLASEGLFDESHKKMLPRYPERIGIITSPTGAAIRDMTRIISRRYPLAKILIYPSLVQGKGAAAELSEGVEWFNAQNAADVIIIGRGGGSIEDLWEFNSELLARTIFASEIPVISAVGHESDFTICDFVADVRASTPSAAAELAVPEQSDLKNRLDTVAERLFVAMSSKIDIQRRSLDMMASSPFLKSPMSFVEARRLDVDRLEEGLQNSMHRIVERKTALYKEKTASLSALSPLAVLSRGYGVSYNEERKILKSVKDIKVGERLQNRLSDGIIYADVTSVDLRGIVNGEEK